MEKQNNPNSFFLQFLAWQSHSHFHGIIAKTYDYIKFLSQFYLNMRFERFLVLQDFEALDNEAMCEERETSLCPVPCKTH